MFARLAMLFSICLMLASDVFASCPSLFSMDVPVRVGGVNGTVSIPNAYHVWGPACSNYPGPYADGNGFNHMIAVKSFPTEGTYVDGGTGTITVTAAMVDAFYEQYRPSTTQYIAPSRLDYNCHGLTAIYSAWIDTGSSGIGVLVDNMYEQDLPPQAIYSFHDDQQITYQSSHSFTIWSYGSAIIWGIEVWYVESLLEKYYVGPIWMGPQPAFGGLFNYKQYRRTHAPL